MGLFSGERILGGGGLIIGGSFAFQNGLGLTIKTVKTLRQLPKLKQLTLTVHGLIFVRAYYRKDNCVCHLGGRAYFRVNLYLGELIFIRMLGM